MAIGQVDGGRCGPSCRRRSRGWCQCRRPANRPRPIPKSHLDSDRWAAQRRKSRGGFQLNRNSHGTAQRETFHCRSHGKRWQARSKTRVSRESTSTALRQSEEGSESTTAIDMDARDPHFMQKLHQLGPVKVDHNMSAVKTVRAAFYNSS